MTNKARQIYLDRQKYLQSEMFHTDLSGMMKYCHFCQYQDDKINCIVTQQQKEDGSLCAKAYNSYYKRMKEW